MSLNLRQLEAFAAVVEAGSFSRAAARLGLGQPTVSTHVAALERAYGVSLFERSGRRIRPTRAGSALLAHAREILAARRRAEDTLRALGGGGAGELLVAASTIPAAYLLPRWVAAFRMAHPKASVTVKVGDSREAAGMLREGQVDLAVAGSRPSETRRIRAVAVAEDRLVLAVPPKHPLAGRRRCVPADLKGIPFLQREAGSGTREAVEEALRGVGLDPEADLDSVCELGSTEAVREGVKAGLGAALLSAWAVVQDEAAGLLRTVPLEGFRDRRTFWLLTPADRGLAPLARAFAGLIRRR